MSAKIKPCMEVFSNIKKKKKEILAILNPTWRCFQINK
jgi:hypothetical protein